MTPRDVALLSAGTWPGHWPTHVPSPVQRADGVWLRPGTGAPICDCPNLQRHELRWRQYAGFQKTRGRWECLRCELRGIERKLAAKKTPPAERPDTSPYGLTRAQLVAHWGIPYEQWTLAHHQAHNLAMYRALGWGDAARLRPVPETRTR